MNACTIPPEGWRCTRERGHEGPCAAVPTQQYGEGGELGKRLLSEAAVGAARRAVGPVFDRGGGPIDRGEIADACLRAALTAVTQQDSIEEKRCAPGDIWIRRGPRDGVFAECRRCGYVGPTRRTRIEANRDADRHVPDCTPPQQEQGGDADDARRSTATIAPVTVGAPGDPGAPTETSTCEHGAAFDCPDCRREVLYLDPPQQEGADEKPETLADLVAQGPCEHCGTFGGLWHKLGCPNDLPYVPGRPASPQPEAPVEEGETIPRDYWREVPCGHPPDPVAMYGRDGEPVCHCGTLLDQRKGIEVKGAPAPGPVVQCQSCGCGVAIPPKSEQPASPESKYETAGGDTIREGSGQSPDTEEEWPEVTLTRNDGDYSGLSIAAPDDAGRTGVQHETYVPLQQVEAERLDAQKRAGLADYKRAEEVVEMWVARYHEASDRAEKAEGQLAEIKEQLEAEVAILRQVEKASGSSEQARVYRHATELADRLALLASSTQHDNNQGGTE